LEEAVVTVQIQLGRYVGTMGVNSPLADGQFHSDFPAGFFLGDEFEYAPFGFCQIVQTGLLRSELLGTAESAQKIASYARAHVMSARRDSDDTVEDVLSGVIL